MERLFVYGTLAPGKPNEHILQELEGEWLPATVKGELHQAGWGAELGFPAIKLDDAAGEVSGLLFCSYALKEHWAMLDEFEGEQYERVIVNATLESGEQVEAYVYSLASPKSA